MPGESFNPLLTHDIPQHTVGAVLWDDEGNAFRYLHASGATDVGSACLLRIRGTRAQTATSTNSDAHSICIGMTAVPANHYGWYQIYGSARIETAVLQNEDQLYLSATAGRMDDATGGTKVYGAQANAAQSTAGNLTRCFISFPFTDE